MDSNIQQLIDSGNLIVTLPPGEYKGPFVINRPCTVEGNNTTLWNDGGAVVVVTVPGVTLRNLRIEMIDTAEGNYSLGSLHPVSAENTEIIGYTAGFGDEDTVPLMTKQLKLGTFQADLKNEFYFEIYSPGISSLESLIQDIKLEPANLTNGINKVKIITEGVPSGTFIYGDILMKSRFNRRFYIQGMSSDSAEKSDGTVISSISPSSSDGLADKAKVFLSTLSERAVKKNDSSSVQRQSEKPAAKAEPAKPAAVHMLRRGERINIDEYSSKPMRVYTGYRALFSELDIDMYAFMLDENGVTSCDDDFVFFGNRETMSGALTYMDDNSVQTDLSRVPEHIKRISFVYSIYQPGLNDNFSKVLDPFVSVIQDNREIVRYTASELFAETTIIFMEIYRHNSGWKLNTIGQGYREGLKRLCANYGLIVT